MPSKSLEMKLNKITLALESFEEGKPLPISLHDINFLLGACSQLAINQDKLEESYKNDMGVATAEVVKFRNKWKQARQISVRLNENLTKHKQIATAAKNLSWWRSSKEVKRVLGSLDELDKKRALDFTA